MEKDLEILSKYENWFYTAVKSDYIRALWKTDFDVLIPIYEKWTGLKSNINTTCGRCKLTFMKRFGELYFKNKEEYEIRKTEKNISSQTNETRGEGEDRILCKKNSRGKKSNDNKKGV